MNQTGTKTSFLDNAKLVRRIYIIYIALLLISEIVGFFNMQGGSNFERGAAFFAPKNRHTFGNKMTVSGMAYARSDVKKLELVCVKNGIERTIPLERQKVVYKGRIMQQLATFSTKVGMTERGSVDIFLRMNTGNGEEFSGQMRTVNIVSSSSTGGFKVFSFGHLLALGIGLVFAIIIIIGVRMKKTESAKRVGAVIICGVSMLAQLTIMTYIAVEQNFRISYDLLIHMCSMSTIILPYMLLTKNKKMQEFYYQLLFIWGLGGAVQAVLTPDLSNFPFPGLYSACFLGTHMLIIAAVLYMTYVYNYRPTFRDFLKMMATTIAVAIVLFGINHIVKLLPPYEIGAYFIMTYPPINDGGTIIDTLQNIFGPSPRYVLGLLLLIPVFEIGLSLPIMLGDFITKLIKEKLRRA